MHCLVIIISWHHALELQKSSFAIGPVPICHSIKGIKERIVIDRFADFFGSLFSVVQSIKELYTEAVQTKAWKIQWYSQNVLKKRSTFYGGGFVGVVAPHKYSAAIGLPTRYAVQPGYSIIKIFI